MVPSIPARASFSVARDRLKTYTVGLQTLGACGRATSVSSGISHTTG